MSAQQRQTIMANIARAQDISLQAGSFIEMTNGTGVQLVDILGSGSFGVVWRVNKLDAQNLPVATLALKVVRCANEAAEGCNFAKASIRNEIDVLQACKGYSRIVQIVDFLDCSRQNNPDCKWMILLELLDYDLDTFIRVQLNADVASPSSAKRRYDRADNNSVAFSNVVYSDVLSRQHYSTDGIAGTSHSLIRNVAEGCAKALVNFRLAMREDSLRRGLGTPNAIHGDVKFDNFLVSGGVIQLADFGGARRYAGAEASKSNYVYTVPYLDPTLGINSPVPAGSVVNPLTSLVDEYALGVMLWAMAFDSYLDGTLPSNVHQRALSIRNATNSPNLLEAIIMLTHPDLKRRWTVDKLLLSPFIASFVYTPGENPYVDPQLVLLTKPRMELNFWSLRVMRNDSKTVFPAIDNANVGIYNNAIVNQDAVDIRENETIAKKIVKTERSQSRVCMEPSAQLRERLSRPASSATRGAVQSAISNARANAAPSVRTALPTREEIVADFNFGTTGIGPRDRIAEGILLPSNQILRGTPAQVGFDASGAPVEEIDIVPATSFQNSFIPVSEEPLTFQQPFTVITQVPPPRQPSVGVTTRVPTSFQLPVPNTTRVPTSFQLPVPNTTRVPTSFQLPEDNSTGVPTSFQLPVPNTTRVPTSFQQPVVFQPQASTSFGSVAQVGVIAPARRG